MNTLTIDQIENIFNNAYGEADWKKLIHDMFTTLNNELDESKAKKVINQLALKTLIQVAA